MWSLGVIFYQILYGVRPFGEGLSQVGGVRALWLLDSQVFSLGIIYGIGWPGSPLSLTTVLFLSGRVPVLQEKILREKVIVNANRVDFPPKPVVSEEAKSFIRSCLTYTHATRPDVHAMCNLPYLTTPAPKRGG